MPGYANKFSTTAQSPDQNGFTSSAVDSTGSNLLVAVVCWWNQGTPATFSDSKGNTWTKRASAATFSNTRTIDVYDCIGGTVGAGHTFSVAGGTTVATLFVYGFSGGGATPFDMKVIATSGAGGLGTFIPSIQAGVTNPCMDGCIVFTACNYNASDPSLSAGFTGLQTASYTGNAVSGGAAYQIQTTATSVNPTWSGTAQVVEAVNLVYAPSTPPAEPDINAVLAALDGTDIIDYKGFNGYAGGDTTWTKLGGALTASGTHSAPAAAPNGFGPGCRLTGAKLGVTPQAGQGSDPTGGFFTFTEVDNVRAVLALLVVPDITTDGIAQHGPPVGFNDATNAVTFGMGVDSLNWMSPSTPITAYENTHPVGGALTRKLGTQIVTLLAPVNYKAQYLGANAYGISDCTYGAVVMFNAVPNQARVTQVVNALYAAIGKTATALRDNLIVFNGDSRFQALAASEVDGSHGNETPPGTVVRSLGAPYPDWQNDAVYGFNSSQTITVITNTTAPTLTASTRTHKTAILLIGLNDMVGQGATPAATFAHVQTIVGQYVTAGCDKIIVCTEPDAKSVSNQTQYNTDRLAYNVLLRTLDGTQSGKVKIVDLEAEPNMGPVGSRTNHTLFQAADEVHWTTAGCTNEANYIVANSGGLFAPSGGGGANKGNRGINLSLSRIGL